MKKYMFGILIIFISVFLLSCNNAITTSEVTVKTYMIVFESNGGSLLNSIEVEKGEAIPIPEITREGYTLDGWYTSINGGETLDEKWSFYSDTVIQDVTLYAKWTINEYDITYNVNGGINGSNPNTYTIETSTITLDNPTKEGYTFDGWYNNEEYNGDPIIEISLGSIGDITLYARWEITIGDYDAYSYYQVGSFEDQLDYTDGTYYIYYYSEGCPSCQTIKTNILSKLSSLDEDTLLLFDVYQNTVGLEPSFNLTHTPSLVKVVDHQFSEVYVGVDEILPILDELN